MVEIKELEEAIKALEPLFQPDRYISFAPEFELIVKMARFGQAFIEQDKLQGSGISITYIKPSEINKPRCKKGV